MNWLLWIALLMSPADAPVRLVTLDPGHFHASLVHKEMYAGVAPEVTVYAPPGEDLRLHLDRVNRYNARPDRPTSWKLEVVSSPDFLERLLKEKRGNVVVLAGRNRVKIDRIKAALDAGFHVLSDKPWVIDAAKLPVLEAALETAARKGLVAYDMMTERYEVTNSLQKELVNTPGVFGTIERGAPDKPAVYMESVHFLAKNVSGAPLIRPQWFFDVREQGEGLSDVGTHLVDLVNWTLFSRQLLNPKRDVTLVAARRWPTVMTREQFQRVTGAGGFPEYLGPHVKQGSLEYFCNTQISYAVRGVHVKLDVLWNYESPTGVDTHLAVYRGTKSDIEVRDNQVYVIPKAPGVKAELEKEHRVEEKDGKLRVIFPDSLRVGHEAHFAEVAGQFFAYLKNPKTMPAWEKANLLAKYFITTRGVALSHAAK